jgi:hypothetical protein
VTTTSNQNVRFGSGDSQTNYNGKAQVPDTALQFLYESERFHVSLRGALRYLQVKTANVLPASPGQPNSLYDLKKTGYGYGVSGRLFVWGKNNVYAQWNGGDGIGRLLNENDGYAVVQDVVNQRLGTIKINNALAGYEHAWTENIKTNIAATYTHFSYPSWVPANNTFDIFTEGAGGGIYTRSHTKYMANIIWSPVKNVNFGLEYAYLERKLRAPQLNTKTGEYASKGTGQRYMVSAIYNF